MNYPLYFCPACNYKFIYNFDLEYCACPKLKKKISLYTYYNKYLFLIDNNSIQYCLDFINNSSRIHKENTILFKADHLIPQDFINNFPSLVYYL